MLKLMHTKVVSRWSDKSLNVLLKILKDSHPEGVAIPTFVYDVKKKLRELTVGYECMHDVSNICMF